MTSIALKVFSLTQRFLILLMDKPQYWHHISQRSVNKTGQKPNVVLISRDDIENTALLQENLSRQAHFQI